MRPVVRKKRVKEYFLPFLIIIGVAVLVILGVTTYQRFTFNYEDNKATVFVVEGQAKIQPWGSTEWRSSENIDGLLSGDKIRTSRHAKVILRFFDGTELRLNADTQLALDDIVHSEKDISLLASLEMGSVWIQKATMKLSMNDVRLNADSGDLLSVEDNQGVTTVRVLEGGVDVYVLKWDDIKVNIVDTITLLKGQEGIFDEDVLSAFRSYQSPYVEDDISDSFYSGAWYLWNHQLVTSDGDYSDLVASNLQPDDFLDLDPPAKPNVISPPNLQEEQEYTFAGEEVIVTGTVALDADKMKVFYSAEGVSEVHHLSQFNSGSDTWIYKISANRGNIVAGLNTYKIVAIDEFGNESLPLILNMRLGKSDESGLKEEGATADVQ